jgi:hypothetical protein
VLCSFGDNLKLSLWAVRQEAFVHSGPASLPRLPFLPIPSLPQTQSKGNWCSLIRPIRNYFVQIGETEGRAQAKDAQRPKENKAAGHTGQVLGNQARQAKHQQIHHHKFSVSTTEPTRGNQQPDQRHPHEILVHSSTGVVITPPSAPFNATGNYSRRRRREQQQKETSLSASSSCCPSGQTCCTCSVGGAPD